MTVHLDTSVLIDVLTRTRPLFPAYQAIVRDGHRITLSTIALYEWIRGPRSELELGDRRQLCPDGSLVGFGPVEATKAAELYRRVKRGRGREFDIAIAACAIEHDALLWTVNPEDFRDIPDLQLYVAPAKR